jgi:hypothetical protein
LTVATVGPIGMDQDGGTHTTIATLRAGTAVISALARPRDDPQGPPTQHWQITLIVVA